MARTLFNVPQSSGSYTGSIPRVDRRKTRTPSIVVNTRVIGVPAHLKALKNYTAKMDKAVQRGVTKAVKHLLKETLKVTPKAFGTLRSAGSYAVQDQGKNVTGIVYFDPTVAPYAIYVHEDLTKYHKPPTMAKFLQRTQFRVRGEMSRIVREEMAKVRK